MSKPDRRSVRALRGALLGCTACVGCFLLRERAALVSWVVFAAGLLAVGPTVLLIRTGGWAQRGLLLAAVLVAAIAPLGLYRVEGDSMDPTLVRGDVLLAVRVFGELERGDIVVLESPEWRDVFLVKRVSGLPGDWISQGQLVQAGQRAPSFPVRLNPGRFMVVGDNPSRSRDGRHFGPVPRRLVVARVIARLTLWPRLVDGLAVARLRQPCFVAYR